MPQEGGSKEQRFEIEYFEGVNSSVQSSISKKTEFSHIENGRSPQVGVIEKREGQTPKGTSPEGNRFVATANYGLIKFPTESSSQQDVFRVSASSEPTQTLSAEVSDQILINESYPEGSFSSPTYSVGISSTTFQTFVVDNVSVSDPDFLTSLNIGTVSVRNDFESVNLYYLSTDDTWVKLSDADAQDIIGGQFDFAIAENKLILVNQKDENRLLEEDGVTVVPSSTPGSLYKSPHASKVCFYKNRIHLADYIRNGIRYPTSILRSSYPLGIVALVDGDHLGTDSEIDVTETKYFNADSGMNEYDIYRGGSKIKTITVNGVNEFSINIDASEDAEDISTASVTTKSFNFTSQSNQEFRSVFWGDEGLKFYVLVGGETVFQYSASTAYDISTLSYSNKSFSLSSQITTGYSIFFRPSGTTMYAMDLSSDIIYQYTLSTAWDVSTASYASKSFDATTEESDATSFFIKDDGLTLYIAGFATDAVYQYTLGTAWDISTAVYDTETLSVQDNPFDLSFNADGDVLYILTASGNIYQYTLSTAWDISTASYDNKTFRVSTQAFGFTFNRQQIVDGTSTEIYFYITDSEGENIQQWGVGAALNSSDEIWVAGTFDGDKQYRWVSNPTSIVANNVKQYDTLSLSGGDGDPITLFETVGDVIMIGNKFAMATWNDYELENFDLNIGCASKNGSVKLLGNLFFIHYSGIYSTTGGRPSLVSRKVERYINGATKAGIESSAAGFKGLSVMFTIGDVTLYKDDGSVEKVLSDVCLEYNIADQNWFVHTDMPISEFTNFIASNGTEHLLGSHEGNSKSVMDVLSGNTDDGKEIFFRADTQDLQILKEFERYVNPISVITETQRGSQVKCFISNDQEKFYELEGSIKKGVSILKVNSQDTTRTQPVITKKFKLSYRDSSRQRCRLSQAAITYLPTNMDEIKE